MSNGARYQYRGISRMGIHQQYNQGRFNKMLASKRISNRREGKRTREISLPKMAIIQSTYSCHKA